MAKLLGPDIAYKAYVLRGGHALAYHLIGQQLGLPSAVARELVRQVEATRAAEWAARIARLPTDAMPWCAVLNDQ